MFSMAKTMLVVDDSASPRQMVSIALNGKDALGKLAGQKIGPLVSETNGWTSASASTR